VISAGPITIDPEKREARVHGDLLLLTAGEFFLLETLAREPDGAFKLPSDHGWLERTAGQLAAKLTRVGIEHDLARTDGLYRLFKPEQGGE
jgi:DNA-binding response OmpR family regulator